MIQLAALAPLLGQLLDKVLPDPAARDAARAELARLAQSGDLAQIEVNKIEAAAPDLFRAGWRPFVGWVCGFAFAWDCLVRPLALTVAAFAGFELRELPALNSDQLLAVLGGLLGLGGLRTIERKAGKA